MPKKKPAKKKPAKKPAKKRATKAAAVRAREGRTAKAPPKKRKGAGNLERAHSSMVRVIDTVSTTDRAQIARLRRLVDHLDMNAKARG